MKRIFILALVVPFLLAFGGDKQYRVEIYENNLFVFPQKLMTFKLGTNQPEATAPKLGFDLNEIRVQSLAETLLENPNDFIVVLEGSLSQLTVFANNCWISEGYERFGYTQPPIDFAEQKIIPIKDNWKACSSILARSRAMVAKKWLLAAGLPEQKIYISRQYRIGRYLHPKAENSAVEFWLTKDIPGYEIVDSYETGTGRFYTIYQPVTAVTNNQEN